MSRMSYAEYERLSLGNGCFGLFLGGGVWLGVAEYTHSGSLGFAAACACLLIAPSVTRWNVPVEYKKESTK